MTTDILALAAERDALRADLSRQLESYTATRRIAEEQEARADVAEAKIDALRADRDAWRIQHERMHTERNALRVQLGQVLDQTAADLNTSRKLREESWKRADRAETALRNAMDVIHAHRIHAPACGIYRGGEPDDCTCYLRAEVQP